MGKADRAVDDADDVDDTDDDADDGSGDAAFDNLIEKLTDGGNKKSGRDPMDMFMLMMMEEKREARAEKAQMQKLILSVLPILLGNKGPDPLMMEIVKSTMNGNQQEKFAQSMMQIQQQQAASNMQMIQSTMENTNKLKDEMTARQLDMMEARMEKQDAPAASPVTEIIRELRLAVEPLVLAKMGQNATAAAAAKREEGSRGGIHGNPAARIEAPKDVIPMVLRILKEYHEKKDTFGPTEKRGIRAKLATIILDAPALAKAICNEDTDAVTEICKPYVLADEIVMGWVMQPNVSTWLGDYLINQIAPVLDSMMEAEEKDSGTFVDGDNGADDGGTNGEEEPGDGDGGDGEDGEDGTDNEGSAVNENGKNNRERGYSGIPSHVVHSRSNGNVNGNNEPEVLKPQPMINKQNAKGL